MTNMIRSEEHTSELQSLRHLVCRLLLEKKKRRFIGLVRACACAMTTLTDHLCAGAPRSERREPQRRGQGQPRADPNLLEIHFFNGPATAEIYALSLHDALPI